jgi:tetratricopeptide (TPR) repeat protein
MKRSLLQRITLLVLLGTLCACSGMPPSNSARQSFAAAQKEQARALEAEGRLAEALVYWRSLQPLEPGNSETSQAVVRLEKEISRKATDYYGRGEKAWKRGDTRQASTWFLKVLALEPGHERALASLRKIQSRQVRGEQSAKSTKENVELVERRTGVSNEQMAEFQALYDAGDYNQLLRVARALKGAQRPELVALQVKAHLKLADILQAQGDSAAALAQLDAAMALKAEPAPALAARADEVRLALGQEYFVRGKKLLSTDIDAAIVALEKAVKFDPGNTAAEASLLKARKMQDNLRRIEGR